MTAYTQIPFAFHKNAFLFLVYGNIRGNFPRIEWKIFVPVLFFVLCDMFSRRAEPKNKIPRLCLKTGDYDVWLCGCYFA